jgi:hypothetical protein
MKSGQVERKSRDDSRLSRLDSPGWCTGKPRHGYNYWVRLRSLTFGNVERIG